MLHEAVPPQVVVETERFALRPLRKSDVGLIEMHASDVRVARMTQDIPHPMPPGAAEAHIRQSHMPNRTTDVWAIDGTANGQAEVMGLISLERLDRKQSEVSYWVAPAFWNGGIATEVVEALLAANPLASHQIFASVFQDNPSSARVLTNCGFAYLGDAEAFSVARNATVPTWTYSRTM
jgi:RimJ/RimL family protein N-acetyltransferase